MLERVTKSRALRTGLFLMGLLSGVAIAEEKPSVAPSALKQLNAEILTKQKNADELERMLYEDSRTRLRAANLRESRAWREIQNRQDWEHYRDPRIADLRKSLGSFPKLGSKPLIKTTGEIQGTGYRIEKIVFESRPGLWVTANLYRPEVPADSMPGILICHSHHNPKTQSELQDMGSMWARVGCVVLVMDQVGHGERRQHPFRTAEDYKGSFRVSRQDYYFRYNVGYQLQLVGESLIGWMAGDLMRGVDVLLSRPGVDPKRILLLGAVAGGGDPAAVTAALDRRIAAAVPFNFGGPQPETARLGENAEDAFNYAGSGSWESTRNLPLSAKEGFLPWVIVGSTAPRALIYAHEFRWDQDRDPVWKRLNTVYGFYNAGEKISSVHGYGTVKMSSDMASHCNNIGPVHRKGIHEAFQKWFHIPQPDEEFRERRAASELLCLNGSASREIKLNPVHQLANNMAEKQLATARQELKTLSSEKRRRSLQKRWQEKLGDIAAYAYQIEAQQTEGQPGVRIEKFVLTGERNIRVPVLLMIPQNSETKKRPLTVMVAQSGKSRLLGERAETIAELLNQGIAVCLPDLRGMGETRPGNDRSRQSWANSLSATELMLGQTLLGSRLKDLRSLLAYLRTRDDLDAKRFAIWGDSFAAVNASDRNLEVPRRIDNMPNQAEPVGPLLAIFAGLYENDLAAVVSARGGLVSYQSVLESPFFYLPHDALVPGALTVSDLSDITKALAPNPLWMSGLVTGRNQLASQNAINTTYSGTQKLYAQSKDRFQLHAGEPKDFTSIAQWLGKSLKD